MSKIDDAAEFLVSELAGQSRPASEIEALAGQRGIAARTLRDARKRIGVYSFPLIKHGPWHLSLTKPKAKKANENKMLPSAIPDISTQGSDSQHLNIAKDSTEPSVEYEPGMSRVEISARRRAAEWLHAALTNDKWRDQGQSARHDVIAKAHAAGFGRQALDQAVIDLDVRSYRTPYGGSIMLTLPAKVSR